MDLASDLKNSQSPQKKSSRTTYQSQPNLGPEGLTGIFPKGFKRPSKDWDQTPGTLLSTDGVHELFTLIIKKKSLPAKPRVLVFIHGMGEHLGRYQHLPEELKNKFDAFCFVDLLGHGRSQGTRGHCLSFEVLSDDVFNWAETVSEIQEFKKASFYLLGHSLGGLLVLKAAHGKDHQLIAQGYKGLILSAPSLQIKVKVSALKKGAASLLKNIWGSLQLRTGLNPKDISHDLNVVTAYQEDKLIHDRMTPQFFSEYQRVMTEVLKWETGYELPMLFIIPVKDPIIDPEATQKFFKKLQNRAKHVREYPEFFHEPLNELDKQKVFDDIESWVQDVT